MKYIKFVLAVVISITLMNGLVFAQDTTLTVSEDGNVGIGTTAPNTPLHINGTGIDNDGSTAVARIVSGNGAQNLLLDGNEIDATADGLFLNNNTDENVMLATGGGNVGIGTSNPAFPLDVFGTNYKVRYNSGGNVDVLINRASNNNFCNLQYASDGTVLWAIGLRGVSAADGLFFHDEDAGATRMMIDGTSGNVGIGTTTPNTLLHINGVGVENDGATAVLRIISGNGAQNLLLDGNEIDATADGLFLNNNTEENVVLASGGGNVGIGTTTPQGKLDVNGSIFQRGAQLHADYVFEPDYQLESIEEHAEFMWKNKHLKAIPKARVDENGREIVEVGAHRKGIVEELEKAHIYIEQLHQRIKKLEATVEQLATRLDGNN